MERKLRYVCIALEEQMAPQGCDQDGTSATPVNGGPRREFGEVTRGLFFLSFAFNQAGLERVSPSVSDQRNLAAFFVPGLATRHGATAPGHHSPGQANKTK